MATPVISPIPREVQVYINVDPVAKKITSVTPERFWISKQQHQEVRWICTPAQPFKIEFNKKNGTPFYESRFSHDYPCSGLAHRNLNPDPGKPYEYTVTVDGCPPYDPDGVVDR